MCEKEKKERTFLKKDGACKSFNSDPLSTQSFEEWTFWPLFGGLIKNLTIP